MAELVASAPTGPTSVTGARDLAVRLWARGAAWWPVLVGLILTFIATLSWLQWRRPFLEHDDWDMLLPDRTASVMNHTTRLLFEGRYLNYWSWEFGSQSLSARAATVLFALGWLLAVAVMVRAFDIGWWSVPAVAAVYAAPMMSAISYWAATLTAPVWALAITLALLWATRKRWLPHLVVLFLGTALIVIGYPPMALFVVPLLVVLHHQRSWRILVTLMATFLVAYAGGLLTIFALNDLHFGVFGLHIQAWRKPTPLNSLSSLGNHLDVVRRVWWGWLLDGALPIAAAAISSLVALLEPPLRRRVLILLIAFIGAIGVNSLPTISNGTDTPYRSLGWSWAFVALFAVWGLQAIRPRLRVVGAVALVFVAVWSTTYWANGAIGRYHHQGAIQAVETEILHERALVGPVPVVFALPPHRTPAEMQTAWLLGNSLAKNYNVRNSRICRRCGFLTDYVAKHRIGQQPVFVWRRWIVVQFPYWVLRWVNTPTPHWMQPLV